MRQRAQEQERRGMLIAFEGIDGTGKSTQLVYLAEYLRGLGYGVVTTREPSDGPYGRQIREMYMTDRHLPPERELDLFILDRRQHVRDLIEPALTAGDIVLTDRYYFSTAAYQGAAGCDPASVFAMNSFAPEPDLVLLLTMDPELSIARIRQSRGDELNEFEQEESLRRVARLFASFTHPRIRRIDASLALDGVRREVRAAMDQFLREDCQCGG